MNKQAYWEGYAETCVAHGVDPMVMEKEAQEWLTDPRLLGGLAGAGLGAGVGYGMGGGMGALAGGLGGGALGAGGGELYRRMMEQGPMPDAGTEVSPAMGMPDFASEAVEAATPEAQRQKLLQAVAAAQRLGATPEGILRTLQQYGQGRLLDQAMRVPTSGERAAQEMALAMHAEALANMSPRTMAPQYGMSSAQQGMPNYAGEAMDAAGSAAARQGGLQPQRQTP